ncbi:MAG: GNAT family N-acetyltransferase [Bacteroidetes bacterium]|jgi:lipid II:glycine glycyltransferase (peptidoglycan interpeptide bridge formation enzyme)|nr:GNAT family N-acetyltransferase [Bacteroidota bacterium]
MPKYYFKELHSEEYKHWNEFVNECEQSTVFHLTHVLEPLAQYLKSSFRILALYNKDNKIIAGFPFLYRKKFNYFHIVYYPPLIPFYGIILKEKVTDYPSRNLKYKHEIFNNFIEYFSTHFSYIKINFPISESDIRPFQWSGFNIKLHYTFTQELRDSKKIFAGFDADVKRRVKKALEKPFIVENSLNRSKIENHFELQEETFKRQKIQSPLNKKSFVEYIQNLSLNGLVDAYTLQLESKPVASFIYLIHKTNAYYWLAASDPTFYKEGVNQLLFWKSLEGVMTKGITHFDFVGAATPSVAEYKATYNFNLTPYYGIEKSFDRLTRLMIAFKK